MEKLFILILCHFVGDYFLQTDYMAKMKGKDSYVLLAHCITYLLPFYLMFGFNWVLIVIFTSHFILDNLKARYNKTNIVIDQIGHYIVLLLYLI